MSSTGSSGSVTEVGGEGGAGGATALPTFGNNTFLGSFHTPLTERYHQKWCYCVLLCQSNMEMSDKTAIVQLKSSRSMIS